MLSKTSSAGKSKSSGMPVLLRDTSSTLSRERNAQENIEKVERHNSLIWDCGFFYIQKSEGVEVSWETMVLPFFAFRERSDLFPDAKPDTEKPAELNIEKSNTQKQNIYGSSTDSIPFRDCAADCLPERKGRDAMSLTEIESYRELIQENIGYEYLCQQYETYREDLDEIVELIVETVCAKRKTTRIAGSDFPHEIVRSRFLKLDNSHMEFVMDCLQKNTTEIRNMKQYLLTVLFNAPTTISNHYTSQVNHDLYGGW